jgi:hypothetical protein
MQEQLVKIIDHQDEENIEIDLRKFLELQRIYIKLHQKQMILFEELV